MKKIQLLLVILIVSFAACKKDNGNTAPTPPPPPADSGMTEIQITVPASSSFKPAGSKVFSLGTEQTIDASGKAKVTFQKGAFTVAHVFNSDNKLVLSGFITDSSKVISPATTAKVLLYLGYNTPLRPDTLSAYFLNNIDKLPGAKEWEKEFEQLFLADPLILSNKKFVAPLKARMALMIDQTPAVDIQGKASDILVDASDIKSGIQVADDGLSNYQIINHYRRRAHAFLYKMSYRDMAGSPHELKNRIEKSTKSDKDMEVAPISAVNGFFSEIGKNIEGNGLQSFSVTSGPFPLELEDNESEAIYKLRVVGPGSLGKTGLSDDEQTKINRLVIETFLYDLIIPTVGIIMSAPGKPVNGELPSVDRELKKDALLTFLKSMPDVIAELNKGNFKEALKKLMNNVYTDVTGVLMKELFMIALDRESISGGVSSFLNERFENLLYILSMTDAALGASDIVRINVHSLLSSVMEEWVIKARSGQVKLLPRNAVTIPFQKLKLTAEIKNNTQTAYYEWSTSGKYGKLSDSKGHTDQLSFSSSDKDVVYESRVSSATLSNGDNLDYIYVTAFAGGIKVGTDTAIINVKKNKYQIQPTGITLSGRDSTQHEAKMYLLKPDGSNNITPNDTVDYKVIWTTEGKYGALNTTELKGVKTITLYNDNAVFYECLDKNTKEGAETITARIYAKSKSNPESEYKLFDVATGTIKINNDPKKKILNLPIECDHGDTNRVSANSMTCMITAFVGFKEEKDAKSYSVRFYATSLPATYSWNAGAPYPAVNNYVSAVTPGYFKVEHNSSWKVGTKDQIDNSGHMACSTGALGMAEVIITLK